MCVDVMIVKTHWHDRERFVSCSLVTCCLFVCHLLPQAAHLALQHVEPAVYVGSHRDRIANISTSGLHLFLLEVHVVPQHLDMPGQATRFGFINVLMFSIQVVGY